MSSTIIRRPSIILFGDSITQLGFGGTDSGVGWVSLLSSAYSRRADVLNRGFSGYNTRHALDLLPKIFPIQKNLSKIVFCTVFFGANDAALSGERQGVPIEEYRANIKQIIDGIRQNLDVAGNRTPIILITPPPVHSGDWDSYCMANFQSKSLRSNDSAQSYGKVVKDLAIETNCYLLDAFTSLGGNSAPEQYRKYLSDGLHLSECGNKKLFQCLLSVIRNDLPYLYPDGVNGLKIEEKTWDELC